MYNYQREFAAKEIFVTQSNHTKYTAIHKKLFWKMNTTTGL